MAQGRCGDGLPENPRRGRILQLQQRRQREADQHGENRHQRDGKRRERGGRQFGPDQAAKQPREPGLGEIAQQRAERDGAGGQGGELDDGDGQHEVLRRPHALHQGDGVDVALRVAPRAHGDRHRGQQHRGEAREIQEAAGAVDGGSQLPAGFVDLPQALARRLVGLQVVAELLDGRRRAREQRGVGHAAAGLNEPGGPEVRVIDQRGGSQVDEARALIGPVIEHLRDLERGGADAQPVAQRELELREDARVQPHLAGLRDAARDAGRPEGHIGDAHVAAQWISGGHGIQRRELARIAVEDGRGKLHQPGGVQTQPCLLRRSIAAGMGCGDSRRRSAASTSAACARTPCAMRLGEEADRRQRQHGHRHRQQQHGKFAGLEVAPQIARGEARRACASSDQRMAGFDLELPAAAPPPARGRA